MFTKQIKEMFKLLLVLAAVATTAGQFYRPRVFQPIPPDIRPFQPFNIPNNSPDYDMPVQPFQLCTYTDIEFDKCTRTVNVAQNNSIALQLECVRKDKRENCLHSVEMGIADMVVVSGHGYKEARRHGLIPMIFAKVDDKSLYVAVAPRNITLVDLQKAPIYVDQTNHRAFHAAAFLRHKMGHDICAFISKAILGPYISIMDSADYVANPEEILICPNRLPAEFEDYKQCNIEAGLQRAVFVSPYMTGRKQKEGIWQIFETIYKHFGPNSEPSDNGKFNFFDTFEGRDNVIFKNNTISFDYQPTYRNGVNEHLFDHLHCNEDDHPHDPRVFS